MEPKKGKSIAITLVIALLGLFGYNQADQAFGGGGFTEQDCDVTTSTNVVVGASDQVTTVLAAHSQRAWATIQVLRSATSSVSLSFDEGAQAVSGQGFQLNTSTSATFGRSTDFVYVGAVTGVTDTGTTSVSVTECRY